MLGCYALDQASGKLIRSSTLPALASGDGVLWIDLIEPTVEEERQVEAALGIDVPTLEEMREIESSNRLYEESGAVFMTATIVTRMDTDLPQNSQVTFIFKDGRLITNRYCDPMPFRRYVAHLEKHAVGNSDVLVFAGLIEFVVNRIADVVERVGSTLDVISAEVFASRDSHGRRRARRNFQEVLERIGQNGELVSKARESLTSLGRMLTFMQQSTAVPVPNELRSRLRTLSRDIITMGDYATYLGNNVSFVLDATLGMINIDQNNILKIFSVMTVLLLPPSVIGGIYGMNFEHIPYASEPWGFFSAIGLMVVFSLGPYLLFKRRGWL